MPDPTLRSSWAHCRDIVTTAEANGFDNVLLPSGYALGIDGVPFAGGIAAITERIKLLLGGAVRGDVAAAARPPARRRSTRCSTAA